MTINEIIEENQELQRQYARAIDTITRLQNELMKIKKENTKLKDENAKLRKLNNILMRAIEIALKIHDTEAQYRHLDMVLKKIRESEQFKGLTDD